MAPEPCLARTVAAFFFKRPEASSSGRNGDVEGGKVKAEFELETGLLQTRQALTLTMAG
jgi:hypothetical protein